MQLGTINTIANGYNPMWTSVVAWFKGLFSTRTNSDVVPIRLTSSDIRKILVDNNILCNSQIWDRDYAPVKLDWLTTKYYRWYSSVSNSLSVGTWKKRWDCNRFSLMYLSLCQTCHAQSDGVEIEGIAVGIATYVKDTGVGHAINCAIVENNKLVFIEPQTGYEIELSKTERDSLWFILF